MNNAASGILLLLVAGAMNGSFTLPMKFTRRWAWENTWFVWTIFALLIFPPLLTFTTVPGLGHVYQQAGGGVLWVVVACGAGWGISQVFFGLAVESIGIALAFSVILGLSAAVGSLVPLLRLHPEQVLTSEGLAVLTGVALVLLGVGICAVAGRRREANLGQGPARVSVMKGLLFSTISGVGSALVNLGLAFGAPLLLLARHAGATRAWSPNAVWLPLMLAGAVPNLVYCLYLMQKNRTGRRLAEAGNGGHYVLAGIMGVFWFASTVMYGIAAGQLGKLGAVLGWPLFMSLIVITASLWGVTTGEWRGSGRQPLRTMLGGVAVLILAIFVLATAPHWA
jgi:L-rhamnose-H+ transport protein